MDKGVSEMSGASVGLVVGIDASNLHGGGGLTHLRELLSAYLPERDGIAKVIVWGGRRTLSVLPQDQPCIELRHQPALDRSLVARVWWRQFRLSSLVERECDILLVPGGLRGHGRVPWVTMCRNMLPFQSVERRRYGWSFGRLRLELLRVLQTGAFSDADGTIFLTQFARSHVLNRLHKTPKRITVIPHGVNARFASPERKSRESTSIEPRRILYVSTVNAYKHQWHVCEAMALLRGQGLNVELHLVGGGVEPALSRLKATIRRLDPEEEWICYHGLIPFDSLYEHYHLADAFVFASSCENMPNILLEAMAAELPIACSNRGPMPEILGEYGSYFDPENPNSIARAVGELIQDRLGGIAMAQKAQKRAREYSWEQCASSTFTFLHEVYVGAMNEV